MTTKICNCLKVSTEPKACIYFHGGQSPGSVHRTAGRRDTRRANPVGLPRARVVWLERESPRCSVDRIRTEVTHRGRDSAS